MGVGVLRNMTVTSELNCHKSVSMLIRSQVDVVARYKLFCSFFVFICLIIHKLIYNLSRLFVLFVPFYSSGVID